MVIFFSIYLLLQDSESGIETPVDSFVVCEDAACFVADPLDSFNGIATASDCYNICKVALSADFAEFIPSDFAATNCYCYTTSSIVDCFACPVDGVIFWSTVHDSDFDCSSIQVGDCS
jgi:hypothetical protein